MKVRTSTASLHHSRLTCVLGCIEGTMLGCEDGCLLGTIVG
jgi:hypothetical protein